ncbi:MAG: conjugal transfer protein TrbI [Desulfovibrio sp.]|uniref:TrbI/VirB10 family protein n=1 Tax=Desulfovibrio sp. TaxID=885 RepID=UPI0025BA3FF1|nr:TrbI/VirB10 family protein [Desulfovibrio sp.]MCI7568975.1 conjugal transfer protein TrbI [Desulfovibrio sp.]
MADPNGLDLRGNPGGRRMARWPVYVAVAAGVCLVGALVYGIQSNDPKRQTEKTEIPMEGVRGPLLPEDVARTGLVTPPSVQPEQPEPLVVVQKESKPEVDPRVENIRRAKSQSFQTALAAPLVVRRFGENTSAPAASPTVAERRAPERERVSASDSDYDPAADRDKEAFFERANKDTSWQLAQQRTEGMPYEIKTGAVIPAVMVTGINSDLPGNMIAQVARNVYDSATGRFLLIPQGAKLYGVYDSRVIYGQERVLIAWNRLIFPDGSSITLGAMPGADMGGMAGFQDRVNNHYWRIFGSSFLMSAIVGGTAYAMDGTNDGSTTENGTSLQDEMISAMASQLGQTTTTLLQRNLNVKPTLEIRPGYRFNVTVTKDVIFKEPYEGW